MNDSREPVVVRAETPVSLSLSLSHFANAIATHHHLGRGGGRAVGPRRAVRAARPALRGGDVTVSRPR